MAISPLEAALIETWTLYAFGTLVIFARIVCRWRMIGIYNFKPDDYLIVLAWITYTVMTVAAHIVGSNGDLHIYTAEQRKDFPPEQTEPLILGTKWFCAGVATYITFIWLLKMNMLFLYQRVVKGLWVAKFIIPTMGLVIATYISIMMIIFLPCRPYNRMWIVFPDQGELCKPQSMLNMVPPLVMNLVTDSLIMAIPVPVILPVRTTIARKIGLFILFFAGFFIMLAAILRVIFVLVLKSGPAAAIWSCREDAVAILVGQAILIRPLFTKKFWSRDFASGTTSSSSKRVGSPDQNSGQMISGHSRRVFGKPKDPFSLTAALATVQDNDEPEKQISQTSSVTHLKRDSSTSSTYSETAAARTNAADIERGDMEQQHEEYHSEPELSVNEQQHIELQQMQQQNPGRMVINVSREVDVENRSLRAHSQSTSERPPLSPSQRLGGDFLHATNNANCWNDGTPPHAR
ncbi:hypothetical protein B0H66DRAFT_505538 [Apodospora peruviana]|uniref:Rhodopsin domain-containing protein n=1 Tax=Apodospora peruviana TaxID=516989 RepID=A0AAE0HT13_9PEZI|nr:hypothetical protein B0H66DRAFT_505538 [Apodospora peruviana]